MEWDGCLSIMCKFLFLFGVLGVFLIPASCNHISVCVEDDGDLRVDCRIKPRTNVFDSYEFSWAYGTKESLICTNVSGSSAERQFKGKTNVVELEPQGYRMTLSDFTDKLPRNTAYLCKISGLVARVNLEEDLPSRCSAVSVFLRSSYSWIVCMLFFYNAYC